MYAEDPWALAPYYGERYYMSGLGEPCHPDSGIWTSFFDGIARAVVQELAPRTVLDAGCGMGLLVRSLRERNLDAWGFDISEYAIDHAPEAVRPYVRRASVTDEIERTFDLIVCIEVLEHLPSELGDRAVENLARHTDSILFSSTPDDFTEATHLNVQPTDYWVERFGRFGFFRDFDFDATFISRQAMHLQRANQSAVTVARQYERAYWRAVKEAAELRRARLEDGASRAPASGFRERIVRRLRRAPK